MMIVILSILAVYRVSYLIAREDGPFNVAIRLRTAVQMGRGDSWVAGGIACPLCISFWLSWVAAVIFWDGHLSNYILMALGIAGGALVTHHIVGLLSAAKTWLIYDQARKLG